LAQREFPAAPIVGVGVVVIEGNRVLLVRRGQEPLKGEWSIPGGALELGETLEAGARREVAEETGIEIRILSLVEVLDRIVRQEDRIRYHYVLIDFVGVPTGGMLQAGTDAADARWVGREELNSHSVYRLAPATAAVIEKAFGILSRS
jgi:mutator protein MutT